jgi:hypothetical protein
MGCGADSSICPKNIFINPTYWVLNMVIMPTNAPKRVLILARKKQK